MSVRLKAIWINFGTMFVSFSVRGSKEMQKVNKQIVFILQMIWSTMKLINWKERRKRSQRKWSKYANISKSFQLKFFGAWILTHVFLFSIIDYILADKFWIKNCIEEKFFKIAFCRSKTIKSFYLAEIKLSLFAESYICNQIILRVV